MGYLGGCSLANTRKVRFAPRDTQSYLLSGSLDHIAKSKQFAEAVIQAALMEPGSDTDAAPHSMTDL